MYSLRLPTQGWPGWVVYPQMVTHPSTNRARRRATTLIKTYALPLSQTATSAIQVTDNVTRLQGYHYIHDSTKEVMYLPLFVGWFVNRTTHCSYSRWWWSREYSDRSSASVILWFCPNDKTKTAETKIAKLDTEIVNHDTSPIN